MGTAGMRYSLPSREIIADSIESVMIGQYYDGNISVVGCDKNPPGALIAAMRHKCVWLASYCDCALTRHAQPADAARLGRHHCCAYRVRDGCILPG